MLEVEAIGATDAGAPRRPRSTGTPRPIDHVDIHGGGETRAPIYAATTCPRAPGSRPRHRQRGVRHHDDRTRLAGRIDALGNLILERVEESAAKPRWAPMPTR
jgi:hypothetical protein